MSWTFSLMTGTAYRNKIIDRQSGNRIRDLGVIMGSLIDVDD